MAQKKKAKPAPKKSAAKPQARRPAAAKGSSKYDQPGAPWWKKFRQTATHGAGL